MFFRTLSIQTALVSAISVFALCSCGEQEQVRFERLLEEEAEMSKERDELMAASNELRGELQNLNRTTDDVAEKVGRMKPHIEPLKGQLDFLQEAAADLETRNDVLESELSSSE